MTETIVDTLVRKNIKSLKAYQSARGTAQAMDGLLLMDAGENPFSPFDGEAGFPPQMNRYPEPQPRRLLERLAALYGVEANQILLTRGSEEGIRLLLQVFCSPREDALLTCPPTFGLYQIEAQIHDIEHVRVPRTGEFAEELDLPAIYKAIEQSTAPVKLLILCNPGNPSSTPIPREVVEELIARLADSCMVVIDEAYIEFAGHASFSEQIQQYPNLLVLRTLSKSYGLAGLRCGAILGNTTAIAYLRSLIAAYPVPRSSASLALDALEETRVDRMQSNQQLIKSERARLLEDFSQSGLFMKVYPSDTNFICVTVPDPKQLVQEFFEAGVLIRDRSAAIPGAVNIAVGTPEQNDHVIKVVQRLAAN